MQTAQRPLSDLVIIVTGASSGIGLAIAAAFAGEAGGLALFARRLSAPDVLPFAATAVHPMLVPGSVSSPADVQSLFDRVIERFGRVDVVVNCAGVQPRGNFLELPFAEWQSAIDTNLTGYALVCRHALPRMLAAGYGRIINISTRALAQLHKRLSAYSVSKAGASVLTACLALEIDRRRYPNILINDLVPGPTRTAMSEAGQDPAAVVPYVRDLVMLPSGGPSGKVFFKGRQYDFHAHRLWRAFVRTLLRRQF